MTKAVRLGGSLLLFLMLLFSARQLAAQKIRFPQPVSPKEFSPKNTLVLAPKTTSPAFQLPISTESPSPRLVVPPYFVPTYARQNPSGYSYLCRLELKAEDKLPLGIWLRADETNHPGGNIYLRLKMIRF
jgi:hypothetical protein